MKKLFILCFFLTLAGCSEVGYEGTETPAVEPNPGCVGDDCDTVKNASCAEYEMRCVDSALRAVCKTNETLMTDSLCSCDEGQTQCKSDVVEVQVKDCEAYELKCHQDENGNSIAIFCKDKNDVIQEVAKCALGCDKNAQEPVCFECNENSDCGEGKECNENKCVPVPAKESEPDPCTAESDFELFCDEQSGWMKRKCKSDNNIVQSDVYCPCAEINEKPQCVQCNEQNPCSDSNLECEAYQCVSKHFQCKTNDDCKDGSVCDEIEGECVFAPCGTLDAVTKTYHICSSNDIQTYNKNRKTIPWNTIAKIVFHGSIVCDSQCFGIEKGTPFKEIVGEENCTIRSNTIVSDPLFQTIENAVVQNLRFNYDFKFKNRDNLNNFSGWLGARGVLANYVNGVTVDNVTVFNSSFSSELKNVVDAGVLVGNAEGNSEFNNITIDNVKITLNSRDESICTSSKYHRHIGGIIGYAKNVTISSPSVKSLTINSGLAASVGGLIGKGEDVKIYGENEPSIQNTVFDMSEIKILNAERNAGGLVGEQLKNIDIHNLSVKADTIEAKLPCAGGLIGFLYDNYTNSNQTMRSLLVETNHIAAGEYAGGAIGYRNANSKMSFENVYVMNKEMIEAKALNDCKLKSDDEEDKQHNGWYAGGVIGGVRGNELTLKNIHNAFKWIQAESSGGGLIGGVGKCTDNIVLSTASIILNDVINQNSDGKGVVVEADCAGGLIGSAGFDYDDKTPRIKKLNIKNVVNDVTSVKANRFAAGGIGYIITDNSNTADTVVDIDRVISNTKVESENSAGFIGGIKFYNKNVNVSNVMAKSSSVPTNNASGFINSIGRLKTNTTDAELFFNVSTNYLTVNNVLVDSDLTNSVVLNDVTQYSNYKCDNLCLSTDANSYKTESSWSCVTSNSTNKNYIQKIVRSVFNNVYYVTPGDREEGRVDSTLALAWCGSKNNRDEKNNQCIYHREYKYPIRGCWFTDYIYHNGFTQISDLQASDIPIKPYHPYTQEMIEGEDYGKELNYPVSVVGNQNPDMNNQEAVLNTLSGWTRCADILALGNLVTQSADFNALLCPVLTGKLTCLGAFDEAGKFVSDGKCD